MTTKRIDANSLRNVGYEYPDYAENKTDIMKCNDLYKGNQAIKKKGEYYLFKMTKEAPEKYKERLKSATLYNCFKEAVNNYKNLILRQGIDLNVNDRFKKIFNNIDGNGNSLFSSIDTATKNALIDGISFLWIDAPRLDNAITIKDVNDSSFRPYIKNLKRSEIINIQTKKINGVETLYRVVIKQQRIVNGDDFKSEFKNVYIVLERDKGYVCEKVRYGKFDVLDQWNNDLGYIPLIAIYSAKTGFMKADIPLSDLADLNLKLYNATSEKDHIKTMSCNPQPILYGFDDSDNDNEIVIGVNNAIIMEDRTKNGAEYLEVSGKSIDYLNKDLESLENKLDRMALSVVYTDTFKTATEATLNEEKNSLFLVSLSDSIETAYNMAFLIMEEYLGIKLDAYISLTKDFVNKKLSPQMVDELIKLKSNGDISSETLWDALIKGEVLEGFDYEKEKSRIESEKEDVAI